MDGGGPLWHYAAIFGVPITCAALALWLGFGGFGATVVMVVSGLATAWFLGNREDHW